MKKILIVDDDQELRQNLSEVLESAGYQTEHASSAKEALAKLEVREFDVVLLDYVMPKLNGMDALVSIQRLRPRSKVIMMTAFATVGNAVDAIKKGASDYLVKPFKIEALLAMIGRSIEEAKFETCMHRMNFDQTLNSLSNITRRNIIRLLHARERMRLMEITRELGIDDHTKVVFHLRLLKEAGIIEQDGDKLYSLAQEGTKAVECLRTLENYLNS
ncbi:MAG: response regulator [Thermodesulfobacteriota bacterium]